MMNGINNNPAPLLNKLVFGLVRGVAVSVEVFLHRRFGLRYLSQYGCLGAFVMMLYWFCWPDAESGPFMAYLFLYLANWLFITFTTRVRFWRGDNEHTLYSGYPIVLRRGREHREYKVKQFFEPLLVGAVGFYVLQWNRPLGIYWIGAGVCLFISSAWERSWLNWQALALHDATLEQQQSFRRFKEIHGTRI